VFDVEDEDLRVIVAPSRLPTKKSAATKVLAVLVAAGRQAGGFDDGWTSSAKIRDVCRDYGKLDGPNFATALGAMKHEFAFRGKGSHREVKVTRPGFVQAHRFVSEFTSGA
jgi:hypothetical protein